MGRRISDWWLRIYDKGIESGEQHYSGALRYELELKRKVALAMSAYLEQQDDYRVAMAAEILKFATKRNLQVGWASYCAGIVKDHTLQLCRQPLPGDTRVGRRTSWLRNGVAPAVQELIAGGRLDQVIECLGLQQHVVAIADLYLNGGPTINEEVFN